MVTKTPEEKFDYILERITVGETISEACNYIGISQETFYKWARGTDNAEKVARAREAQEIFYQEKMLSIGDGVLTERYKPEQGKAAAYIFEKAIQLRKGKTLKIQGDKENPLNVSITMSAKEVAQATLNTLAEAAANE